MLICKNLLILIGIALVVGCATPPQNTDNICEIFFEKDDWYDDAADARDNWNSPIPVMMAIMHQESRFKQKARPPRKMILGFIPLGIGIQKIAEIMVRIEMISVTQLILLVGTTTSAAREVQ